MSAQLQRLVPSKSSDTEPFSQFSSAAARPFLKWVGGKAQLVKVLDTYLPTEVKTGALSTYVEPFVGGGAFFFFVAQKYPIKRLVIADNNTDLMLAYWTVRDRVGALITRLHDLETRYKKLSVEKREEFYYKTRSRFNAGQHRAGMGTDSEAISRTAELIFLNKTCFNGLYRVNAAGSFNVSFGQYTDPSICDPDNLVEASHLLRRTEIRQCDFEKIEDAIDSESFVSIDPPYRPLNQTSNFTGYSANSFNADDQKRLASFCRRATLAGAKFLLSNSDPANEDPEDDYFQRMYQDYRIVRTAANRMINCKPDRRGKITELLIMNY